MVSLVGYTSDNRVYFLCIFVAIIRVEVLDLTSELRLNNRYYNLLLVRNIKLGYVSLDTRLF
jgi:hypothetical protein